jgi:uroporphyrinogen-III synthase
VSSPNHIAACAPYWNQAHFAMSFAGLGVLSLESRRAKEIEALIRREGGEPFVAPSVQERAVDDPSEALTFLERLEGGEFDLFVCMTGVGLAFWREQIAAHSSLERLSAAMRKVTILSRGPKSLPVLRELGLRADVTVPEPNTWKEIVAAIAARPERRIAVQEYGRPNPEFVAALERLGATVAPMVVYRWDLPENMEPLRTAARRLAESQFDVVLFTSSIQLDHLMLVARELGLEPIVHHALQSRVIASVGPVMSRALESAGIPVDVMPEHPKMAPLVRAASEAAAGILARKQIS